VMYAGGVVEAADVDPLFHDTAHPYSAGLLASLPRLDRRSSRDDRLYQIPGQPPVATNWPNGCRFAPRCAYAVAGRCDVVVPPPLSVGPAHTASCVRVGEWQQEAR
jgi:oligopeptide/dipeptide ABC transporter ATP-binding protein